MKFKRFVKKVPFFVIVWTLIVQIAIGSPSIAQGLAGSDDGSRTRKATTDLVDQWIQQGAGDPAVVSSQAKIEAVAEELEAAGENEFPEIHSIETAKDPIS